MIDVKVTLDDGDVIFTSMNAKSREEVAEYYLGSWFNMGVEYDDMHKAVSVEFPDSEGKFKTDEEYKALIKDAEINIACGV